MRLNLNGYFGEFFREKYGKNVSEFGSENKVNGVVELGNGGENFFLKKVYIKCLMKWVLYGGCISSILLSLEINNGLDEVFRLWEERFSNKERSIILKE